MAGKPHSHPNATGTGGGALLALAGLLMILSLAGTGEWTALSLPADLALAVGSVALAFGPDGIVGASRVGRIALVGFGVGPLIYRLPLQLVPAPVLLGMTILVLITVATVVTAVVVARRGVLHGIARWAPVLLAADAVLILAMSSVTLGPLSSLYLSWQLEVIRPVALLIWGLSIVLHGRATAIRGRASAFNTAWKRSTDVSGAAPEPAVPTESRS